MSQVGFRKSKIENRRSVFEVRKSKIEARSSLAQCVKTAPDAGEQPFVGHTGKQRSQPDEAHDFVGERLVKIERRDATARMAAEVIEDVISAADATGRRGESTLTGRRREKLHAAVHLLLQGRAFLVELCQAIPKLAQAARNIDESIHRVTHADQFCTIAE